jgi:putative phage-type endonuclease
MEQGTTEWFNARLGKITASRLNAVMAKTKSGPAATRANYMMELICQKLSGQREESYSNAAMERGVELEPIARGAYEAANGLFVEEIGLVNHPAIKGFAASPDGLVGDKGLIEIKCPNTATHVEFLKSGKIKRDYILQMHAQMLCTDRDWCDFVSYDDRLDGLEYKCVRVDLDHNLAHEIMMEVNKFLTEMDAELQTILKLKEESK